jgi:pimeloyl-ACP methyl ester carboxylesterase
MNDTGIRYVDADGLRLRTANGRILTRLLPDGRLKIICGGGHLFLLERPAEIAALVADFLTGDG